MSNRTWPSRDDRGMPVPSAPIPSPSIPLPSPSRWRYRSWINTSIRPLARTRNTVLDPLRVTVRVLVRTVPYGGRGGATDHVAYAGQHAGLPSSFLEHRPRERGGKSQLIWSSHRLKRYHPPKERATWKRCWKESARLESSLSSFSSSSSSSYRHRPSPRRLRDMDEHPWK